MPHCNQADCRFNNADKMLCETEAYMVDRRCITFKRRPRGENYRELMKTTLPVTPKERRCREHRINGLVR